MSRKQSREVAFKLLFSLAFEGTGETDIELATQETIDEKEKIYIDTLVSAVKGNLAKIDDMISNTAKGFSFDRIYKVDLTALRLAVGEIIYMPETPDVVAVNEAVNLVKKYGTAASSGYVNGILASVLENKADDGK